MCAKNQGHDISFEWFRSQFDQGQYHWKQRIVTQVFFNNFRESVMKKDFE